MKLHHIRDVLAVAKFGSLRAASRQLGVTQPAITRSIRDIENDLGTALFERHADGARLTPIGEVFVHRAQTIQSEMRRARDEVEQLKGNFVGQVSMAISPGAAITLVPSIISNFRKRYPHVLLRMTESLFQPIERSVASGEIDFYIGGYDRELSSTLLSSERIFDNQRLIIARRGHPLVSAKNVADLSEAQWIRPSFANRPDEVEFERMFERLGIAKPEVVMHTTSTLMTILSIANSDLLTMLPAQWLAASFTREIVEPIILEGVKFSIAPLCIVRRGDIPLTPVAEHLCDLARKAAMNYDLKTREAGINLA